MVDPIELANCIFEQRKIIENNDRKDPIRIKACEILDSLHMSFYKLNKTDQEIAFKELERKFNEEI